MKSSLTSNLCIGLTSNNLFNLINLERGGLTFEEHPHHSADWQPLLWINLTTKCPFSGWQRTTIWCRNIHIKLWYTWHMIHENSFVVKSGPWIWKYSKGGGNPIFKPNIGPVGWYWPEKGRHTSQRKSSPARIEKKILAYNIERKFEFLSMASTM